MKKILLLFLVAASLLGCKGKKELPTREHIQDVVGNYLRSGRVQCTGVHLLSTDEYNYDGYCDITQFDYNLMPYNTKHDVHVYIDVDSPKHIMWHVDGYLYMDWPNYGQE